VQGKLENGKLTNGYHPHAGQRSVHECSARFRICVCGRRWGKTTFALNELYKAAWENTDRLAQCWYVAPNYRQAKTVAWEMIKEVIPEQVIQTVNEAELSIRLLNGVLIALKGADSQDSLRGAKLKFVVLDEYASMRATVWDEVIRPSMADVPNSRAIFIGTPSGFNHFKVLFDKGEDRDPDFVSFQFKTLDNPYVNSKEIGEIKEKTNDRIFRQEYEASFEQMSGSIYPMFSRLTHVVKPQALPEHWTRVVAHDWGSRNPSAFVFAAIEPSGAIWIYDVLYAAGKTVSQWSDVLLQRADFEKIESWFIDPAALAQAREYSDCTQGKIKFVSYNPETLQKINDVNIGINLVSQYLLEGRIKIFDHCEILIQELEQYQWEPSQSRLGADARQKPLKKDDHSVDALRYLAMTRMKGGDEKKEKYKGLDGASEMFWRSHFNEFPKEVNDILLPRETILFGIDEEFANYDVLL